MKSGWRGAARPKRQSLFQCPRAQRSTRTPGPHHTRDGGKASSRCSWGRAASGAPAQQLTQSPMCSKREHLAALPQQTPALTSQDCHKRQSCTNMGNRLEEGGWMRAHFGPSCVSLIPTALKKEPPYQKEINCKNFLIRTLSSRGQVTAGSTPRCWGAGDRATRLGSTKGSWPSLV